MKDRERKYYKTFKKKKGVHRVKRRNAMMAPTATPAGSTTYCSKTRRHVRRGAMRDSSAMSSSLSTP